MRALPQLLGLACLVSVGACMPLMAREDVPAVIVEPTDAGRTELREGLAALLGVTRVTIADDALTRSSTLTLERPEPGGTPDRAATGRTPGGPVEVRLVTDGERCFVIHAETRVELASVRCAPE